MPKKFKTIKDISFDGIKQYPDEVFRLVTPDIIPGVYDYYCITTYGRVWHRYLGKFIKPGINGAGYLYFMASTEYGPKPIQIHRLVMITFNPIANPEMFEVNHEDGNKLNPYIGNLSWSSHKMNVDHAYRTGLQAIGENNVHSKLTNDQARIICELLQQGIYTNNEIANIIGYPCTENIVSSIKQGQSWTSISDNYYFDQRPGKLFDEELVRNLCAYFTVNPKGNLTVNDHCRNALNFYGYSICDRYVDTARKIYNRKYYTNISCDYKF